MKNRIYTIAVLDDKEYDSLHKQFPQIKEGDLKDSLGFADQDKGECYVRRTNVAEIDAATMQHELQELLSKNSSHEDEVGIRWKKGGAARSIVPGILGLLAAPFTGGASLIPALLGAASSIGMNQYAQSRHPEQLGKPGQIGSIALQGLGGAASGLGGAGVSGAIAGGIKGGAAAAPGFMSKAGGILGGVGKGAMAGAKEFAPTPAVPGAITAPALKAPGLDLTTPSFSAGGPASILARGGMSATSTPMAAASPAALPGILGNLGNVTSAVNSFSPAVNPAAATLPSVTPPNILGGGGGAPTPPKPSFMDKVGEFATQPSNLLGAGSLAASMAPQTPQFEMPSSVGDIRSKLLSPEGGLTPLGQQAQLELGNILKSQPQELYPTANDAYYNAALRRTRENYAIAEQQMDAAYNNAGMLNSGEHLAQKAKMKEELARTESALASETEQRRFELARTAKYQAIQEALKVDKDTMDDLVGLTSLDVQTAAMMYGAKVEDVKSIRDALGTSGKELLLRGTTPPGYQQGLGSVNISLGK